MKLRLPGTIVLVSLSIAVANSVQLIPATKAQTPGAVMTVTPRPRAGIARHGANAARQDEIVRLVREISPRHIESTIRKLVSFGTRNTLSVQNDPNRGVGAARDWLFSEFSKAAEQSGGRMTVEKQTFEQQKAARVPSPTMITNVVATLRGTQPESAARTYIVSGHYDSMCTSPTDAVCDAVGAGR